MSYKSEEVVVFKYLNHRNEQAFRRVAPIKIFFNTINHYGEPGWFMEAYDIDKEAVRDFYMKNILSSILPCPVSNSQITKVDNCIT